ncbi:MAG: hypothetical protein K8R35_11375 [Bacteroidales bacterium]|nr:hypothetical protein [Bacteroidales bacterium]
MKIIRIKTNWIILIISLCFNLFFLMGYISSRNTINKIRTPEGRTELIAERLDLSVEQREIFIELRKDIQIEAMEIKQKYKTELNIFWEEVVKDNSDTTIINQSIEKITQGRKYFLIITSKQIQEFMQILNTEQQEKYIKFLRRNKVNME